jgi:hypothetical protein
VIEGADGPGDDPLLKDIYQQIEAALPDDSARKFKPWHKPRKHYLRVEQWCVQLRALIVELNYREGDLIRYLGLPGEDFLDVRTLRGVCTRAKVTLKYLGFDSSAGDGEYETLLSRHEIFELGFIDPFSVLARDRIERLTLENSTATATFRRIGPFDAINLDLCDSILRTVGNGSYFDALGRLCDLQLTCGRVTPWLVFLTTRAIRAQLDDGAREQLIQCIIGNIEAHPNFAEELSSRLSLSKRDLDRELSNEDLLDHPALVKALGLGLGKWLLKLTLSAHPRVSVRLVQSYSYRVETNEPDMLSLTFRFEPIIESRRDATGLAPTRRENPVSPESLLAVELIRGVAEIVDVDTLLASDRELAAKTLEKAADILVTARYDRGAYLTWLGTTPTFGRVDDPDGGEVLPSGSP